MFFELYLVKMIASVLLALFIDSPFREPVSQLFRVFVLLIMNSFIIVYMAVSSAYCAILCVMMLECLAYNVV